MLSQSEVEQVVKSTATKSDKIRVLSRRGYPRAGIAKALNIKYQFVRNVLEDDKRLGRAPKNDVGTETSTQPKKIGDSFKLKIGPHGSVQLPPEVLQQFRLKEGSIVVAEIGDGVFSLLSSDECMRRIRAIIPAWKPGEPLLSEELIADRRREAAAEEAGG